MPEAIAPPQRTETDFESARKYFLPGQPLTPDEGASLVSQEYSRYSAWRSTNVDPKWITAEELYEGKVELRKWDGSNLQRSAIPNNIAFDHVEGLTPYLEAAFFDQPDWFSVEACEDTDAKDARRAQTVLKHYLQLPDDETESDAEMEICLAIKDVLFYGTGFWEWEWDGRKPVVKWLDPANVFTDPGCPSPNIQQCRSVIIKTDLTFQDVRAMRDTPGMKIPPDGELFWLSRNRLTTLSDTTIQQRAATHGEQFSPGMTDAAVLPSLEKITLLRRITRDRIIWTLNDLVTIYNAPNPYKRYNMVAVPCRTVKGRLHGIGLPWSIRYPQRYSESWLNNMSDEAHLAINPPKGAPQDVGEDQMRTYPGSRTLTADPEKLQIFSPTGQVMNAFPIIEFIIGLAGKRNGYPELAQGIARPGNINRTQDGIQQQTKPTDYRIAHIAHHIERYGMGPMLRGMVKMIKYHTLPTDVLYGGYRSGEGEQSEPITAEVLHRPMRFKLETAAKMLSREKLAMAVQGFGQTCINGPVMQGLAQARKAIDFEEYSQMVQDSVGSPRRYRLVRNMTEEEIEQMNQPSPDAQMASQDAQRAEQTRLQIAQGKFQTELQKEEIKKQPDPFAAQIEERKAQADMQKMAIQSQIEERKANVELQSKLQMAQAKIVEMEEKLRFMREKNAIDAQSKRQMAESKMLETAMAMQAKQAETQMGLQATAAQSELAVQGARDKNEMMKQSGQIKLEQQKAQGAIRKPGVSGAKGASKK